jgi:hypothetical protein
MRDRFGPLRPSRSMRGMESSDASSSESFGRSKIGLMLLDGTSFTSEIKRDDSTSLEYIIVEAK